MSNYDVTRIEKGEYFGIRPSKRGRGKRTPYVIGFDSEADDSKPFMFQFSEPDLSEDDTWVFNVDEDTDAGMSKFMEYVCRRLLGRFGRKHEVIIYGWNLPYEWTQLFHDRPDLAAEDEVTIFPMTVTDRTTNRSQVFKWHVYNDKRVFAKILHEQSGLTIRVLDGMMFYKTGLDKAAKMLGLGEKYKPEPCKLPGKWHENGHKGEDISRELKDDPEFLMYARRDAYITRLIGQKIVSLHEDYDIPQTISAPHFASSVFKRRFLTREIERPEQDLEQAGLWSYHGGKNGFYLPGPAHIDRCWQYDITSAYPEAMRQLPDIESAAWKALHRYVPGVHAIYICTLQYTQCRWRGMMTYDGEWPESGYIEDVALTSYELDAMVSRGEAKVITARGWQMVGDPGGPLARYVDRFFEQKLVSEGVERETAKLLLNSLYGKFFQKVALGVVGYYDFDAGEIIEHNPDGMYDWKAGGLYHPPIASLITGYVRAKIHGMEHKYESIMTSTDGIFAMQPPDPADIGTDLGKLTVQEGSLDIWRERLYIFRSPDLEKPKAAYHGFWGTREQLESIPLAPGTYKYSSRHMVTLKESLKAHKTVEQPDGALYEPGSFVMLPRVITF